MTALKRALKTLVVAGLLTLGACFFSVSCSRSSPTAKGASQPAAVSPSSSSASAAAAQQPIQAKFSVLVRGPVRTQEPIPLEDASALPVQTGGAMVLEAQLDQPAFIYLVWINCQGRVLPLYPWNNETLEVTDVDQPPPVRRASNRVFSPMLGRDWTFTEGQGLETVLLLARQTPLTTVKLGEILGGLKQPATWQPSELAMLALDARQGRIESFLPAKSAAADTSSRSDDSLTSVMQQLGQHFELVQAVRFAHGKPEMP